MPSGKQFKNEVDISGVSSPHSSPVPICDDLADGSEGFSSFCMPATVTAFQVATMKSQNFCAYHKLNGKLIKLNETVSKVAYLYVSPADTKKLSRKDKLKLYADGVRDLHIHKQYEGRLKCEYVGTKSIKVSRFRKYDTEVSYNWVWWIFALCVIIIFGCLIYYFRCQKVVITTEKPETSTAFDNPPEDFIVW